jgi:demethylmenaquinone methyltransferase / 2-methoxy-6-polyprenyl-1,4-benzoquinol methylase
MLDERTRHARALFDGVAPSYGSPAEVMSFGQYGRWRRALVRKLAPSGNDIVLDVATGTGLIARDIIRASGARVVGVDQSEGMLANGSSGAVRAAADANGLPFGNGRFDVVVFSYLFRYVADPPATLGELVRVLKPGGTIGSVEFGVPSSALPRIGWHAYARGVFPQMSRGFGQGWHEVGSFLPESIIDWANAWPIERQVATWRDAGLEDVRVRTMTFGTAVLMIGRKRGG